MTSLLTGLISYYKLNEAAGNTRVDSRATGNDLSEVGGTIAQGSPLVNAGVDANGVDIVRSEGRYLSSASPTGLNTGASSFTITAWVRVEGSTSQNLGIIGKFDPTGNQRQFLLFYFTGSDTFRFGVSSDGSDDFSVNDDEVGVLNETHFIVAWYDGDGDDTVNIQTNNGTISSAAGPTSVFGSTSGLDIGRSDLGSEQVFEGKIDEVGFWSRSLTASERAMLWNKGSGLPLESFAERKIERSNSFIAM